MSTSFTQGQVVRSLTNEQGLKFGLMYRIVGVSTHHTPFGSFVTYLVNADISSMKLSTAMTVVNGHVVLESEDAS